MAAEIVVADGTVLATDMMGAPAGKARKPASPVPGESERPCFAVLDDWTEHKGRKLRPGVWLFGIKPGKGDDDKPHLTEQWICSPLHVEAVTTDAQEGNYGRLLRYRTTLGKWKTWAMPMELLKGDSADMRGELLAAGVEIAPDGHRLLTRYLQDRTPARRVQCALQTGWAGEHVFVLPGEVIGPGADAVVYQSGERGADEYTTAGTLAGWRDGVARLAVGNPLLMLALSAAFAGPVLLRANAESGGVHLVGDSSTGKTTAIEAACSVWGGANFRRSWRSTANGLEGVAALFNDCLLALDEISECDPRDVGAIVYSLGNGKGKQRASRTGSARAVTRWRCCVLSSGERTISTSMEEAGQRIKAGQTVRLLDVPAHHEHGAWDELHSLGSGAAFSDALRRAARKHYGHAGRAFLRALTHDRDTDIAQVLEGIKSMDAFKGESGQAIRAAARFALLALAGELATAYKITGWSNGDAIDAAAQCFASWQSLRDPAPVSMERGQVLGKVAAFIDRHGDSRFSSSSGDSQVPLVRDRAGWWKDGEDGQRLFMFTADGMREALRGFDFARGLDVLQEVGALPPSSTEGKRATKVRAGGRSLSLYIINPQKLEV